MYYKSVLVKFVIFALGVGAGFLTGKKIYEEYYAALAQEEINSVKERFESNWKPIRSSESKPSSNENGMTDGEYDRKKGNEIIDHKVRTNNNSLTRSSLDDNPNERAKRNYNLVQMKPEKVILPDPEPDEEEDGPVTDAAGRTEKEMDLSTIDRTKPYLIDAREFSEEFEHHDKVSLYYYKVDDVLCEENEELLEDRDDKIGYDSLSALDMQTTVWVRNEPLCIDYEIVSINKSYAEAIHGIGIQPALSPRERYNKKQKEKERERENREE